MNRPDLPTPGTTPGVVLRWLVAEYGVLAVLRALLALMEERDRDITLTWSPPFRRWWRDTMSCIKHALSRKEAT